MLAGLFAGAGLGIAAHLGFAGSSALEGAVEYVTEPLGQIFLKLLFMLVLPIILSALSLGVAGLGDGRATWAASGSRRWPTRWSFSSIAVVIGLTLVNLLQPGGGITPEAARELSCAAGRTSASAVAPAG